METEPPVGMLTLVCRATGGEFDSGVVYCDHDLARARKAQILVRCRYCGETHLLKFSDARLSPIGSRLTQISFEFDA
jgi:hypothetical protein